MDPKRQDGIAAQAPDRRAAQGAEEDLATASADYATRFAGPVGQWMLGVQQSAVESLLADEAPSSRILDVGGAHGQLAVPLSDAGRPVTVTGSADACGEGLRARSGQRDIPFVRTPSLNLPFPDRSYDLCLCLRLLTHSTDWRRLIGELCRVADHAVILDYPTYNSLNRISKPFFRLKKKIERNTRTYRLFSDREIVAAFRVHGYAVTATRRQFFWPMALHRGLSRRAVSKTLERLADALGWGRRWGSPVIVRAERGLNTSGPASAAPGRAPG